MILRLVSTVSSILLVCSSVMAGDYPKSSAEREMEEMGSLSGGNGIIFRPSKEKSTATSTERGKANKYLYQASLDILKFTPLASADRTGGTIITEWYSPRDQKNTQFKLTVYIKDHLITPEALEVVAFQRKKHNGAWSDQHEAAPIALVFEDKILRKARALYQESKQ